MKLWWYAVATVFAGMATGISTGWYEVEMTPRQFEPSKQTVAAMRASSPDATKLGPRAVVADGPTFDFGSGQRYSRMRHTFVIRNQGDEALKLTQGSTSCKCTLSELKKGEIPPGGSADVTLEWTVSTDGHQFRQTAEIYTNDPVHSSLMLVIQGSVSDLVRLEPRELVLSDVSASEGATVGFALYGFDVENLAIVEHEFENQETAEFFHLEISRHEASGIDLQPAPSVVLRGTLTVKPGLPLGPINQTIHLRTNIEQVPELVLPITGSVVGDISIVGAGLYSQQRNLLMLGQVDAEKGFETTLRVLVKGPYRHDVRLKIKEVDPPDVLAATLGEATPINDGAVYMYPLKISIPPGCRPIVRMGSDRGEYGRIVIETTHPDTKLVPLRVRFAVE